MNHVHDRSLFTVPHIPLYQVRVFNGSIIPAMPITLRRPPTRSSSITLSPFHLIFRNAILTYNKRTKNDLLFHPLASLFQSCNDPAVAISLLQTHAQLSPQHRISDEQLKSLLTPILIGLYAISSSDGEGVGLVIVDVCSFRTCVFLNKVIVIFRYYRRRMLS